MAYYRDSAGTFDLKSEQFLEIFAEFDFVCADEECDFFCPACRKMLKCEAYKEFKDEWEAFYM